jgi:hypothetical protein
LSPNVRHGGLWSQLTGVGLGHLDVHPGHTGARRAQQPGDELFRSVGRDGFLGRLVGQLNDAR